MVETNNKSSTKKISTSSTSSNHLTANTAAIKPNQQVRPPLSVVVNCFRRIADIVSKGKTKRWKISFSLQKMAFCLLACVVIVCGGYLAIANTVLDTGYWYQKPSNYKWLLHYFLPSTIVNFFRVKLRWIKFSFKIIMVFCQRCHPWHYSPLPLFKVCRTSILFPATPPILGSQGSLLRRALHTLRSSDGLCKMHIRCGVRDDSEGVSKSNGS